MFLWWLFGIMYFVWMAFYEAFKTGKFKITIGGLLTSGILSLCGPLIPLVYIILESDNSILTTIVINVKED